MTAGTAGPDRRRAARAARASGGTGVDHAAVADVDRAAAGNRAGAERVAGRPQQIAVAGPPRPQLARIAGARAAGRADPAAVGGDRAATTSRPTTGCCR